MDLRGRDFISLKDYTEEALYMILDTAADLKRKQKRREPHELLRGKTMAMIFDLPSTRTRISMETLMTQLGGHAQMITSEQYWTTKKESLADSARVFSRYVDGVYIRTFLYKDIEEFARYASVPVINAYCDMEHPCQVMADLMTTVEKKRTLRGRKTTIAWGASNFNKSLGVVNSTLYAVPKLGMDLTIACPEGYEPDPDIVEYAKSVAKDNGSQVEITGDLNEAVRDADVIHIKAWAPHEITRMGPKGMDAMSPHKQNPEKYKKWLITQEHLDLAKKGVNVQHALPVERGLEALDEILDGPNSVIFDEAENRLHTAKAVAVLLLQ